MMCSCRCSCGGYVKRSHADRYISGEVSGHRVPVQSKVVDLPHRHYRNGHLVSVRFCRLSTARRASCVRIPVEGQERGHL